MPQINEVSWFFNSMFLLSIILSLNLLLYFMYFNYSASVYQKIDLFYYSPLF